MIARLKKLISGAPTLEEELTSLKLREKFTSLGIDVGLYSYGCFDAGRISRGTSIGRYCSFSPTCRVQTRNHGIDYLGLTPYFYEPALGMVEENNIPFNRIEIQDDVWIGANVVIVSSAGTIGRGAAIGAGAIVTKPVPPYAVVAGNPARLLRMRFDENTIAKIEETQWWEKSPDHLKAMMKDNPDLFMSPAAFFNRD